MPMTTTARPSTRRSTRLRKGTLALLAYNVREQAAQAQAETIAAQATKKRLAQDDGETKAPPSKHSAVPKPLPRLSTKSTIESPEKTGQKVRQRFMETIQEQKESTESTEPSDSEESSREELDLEDSNLPEHVELSGHRGANQDKATLPRKVKEAQSTPLAKIPGAVNPYPAARVTKRTEKKVTFVPTPFKKPSRRTSTASPYFSCINQDHSPTLTDNGAASRISKP